MEARRRSSVYFGAITLVAGGLCWLTLLISWWLFFGLLVIVMILCGFYVGEKTPDDSAQRWAVGWVIAMQIAAAVITGGVQLNTRETTDRTEDLLVCGSHKTSSGGWVIETSAGNRNLQPGIYNDRYYRTTSQRVASLLEGKWVRVTEHGHDDVSYGPYVTRAETLRPGSCG